MEPGPETKQLVLHETFGSWKELYNSIVDHGVTAERGVSTIKKCTRLYVGKCRMRGVPGAGCPWHLRAIRSKKTDTITITVLNLTHTCERSDHYCRQMHSRADRMADHIFDIVQFNKQTRPCVLRDTLKAQVHPDIRYHTAHAARNICIERVDGKEADSFHLIPAHCHHILQRDPGATAFWKAPNGHFSNLFICPSASNQSFTHCRPLIAFDGAHTRSSYPQMLLLATALDANQTVILLAYCMAPGENETEWLWFFKALKTAMPVLDKPNTLFMSDREKGLLVGIEEVFPRAWHVYCVWHMKENIKKLFKKEPTKMFDSLVWASTREQFERRMERIEQKFPAAAAYIKNTADPSHYCRAFIPGRRWGKETSQHAESQNKVLKPQRSEIAFNQSCQIWDYMMKTYFDKRQLAESSTARFAPNIMYQLKKISDEARNLLAVESSREEVRVTDGAGHQFLVNLSPEWKCTCGDFQDMLLPCVHAWRALTILKKRHFDYVSPLYSSQAFRSTYSASIPALLKEDLVPDPNCGPALKVRKRGRPTEKAKQRYAPDPGLRNARRCRVCGEIGHDRRHCQHMKTRRSAQAEEWNGMHLAVHVPASPELSELESDENAPAESDAETMYSEEQDMFAEMTAEADMAEEASEGYLAEMTEEDITSSAPGPFSQLLRDVISRHASPTRLW